jgi:hypothetical protein
MYLTVAAASAFNAFVILKLWEWHIPYGEPRYMTCFALVLVKVLLTPLSNQPAAETTGLRKFLKGALSATWGLAILAIGWLARFVDWPIFVVIGVGYFVFYGIAINALEAIQRLIWKWQRRRARA